MSVPPIFPPPPPTPSGDSIVHGVLYFFGLHIVALIPNFLIVSKLVALSGASKETIAWAPIFAVAILGFSSLLYQVPLALYLASRRKPKAAKAVAVCAAIGAALQVLVYLVFYLGL